MRVLVADDNKDAADTLGMLLRLWGHEVRVAYDGLSALQLARRFKPHVALLDIQMPKMNGGDAAIHLRRQSESENIWIIAVSASDPNDPRLARYEGAFDAFLRKPCELEQLQGLLTDCRPYAPSRRETMGGSGWPRPAGERDGAPRGAAANQ
jgi:CheY-like chemotaxis protein